MVQEVRRIVLNKEEFALALEAYNRMKTNFMPKGKVSAWDIIDDTSVKVTVTTAPFNQKECFILEDAQLLQPIIRFCLENNIMLPRNARKSVLVNDTTISLCIAIDSDTFEQRTGISETALYAMA